VILAPATTLFIEISFYDLRPTGTNFRCETYPLKLTLSIFCLDFSNLAKNMDFYKF
jgi:hypothetical protein